MVKIFFYYQDAEPIENSGFVIFYSVVIELYRRQDKDIKRLYSYILKLTT